MKKLTDPQRRALTILREKGAMAPKWFASCMWPDSPAWKWHYNTGPNGATAGKGMWLCAGSYLSKLVKMGYVRIEVRRNTYQRFYRISELGKGLLDL
ncbi:hypothetical protein LCGC14_1813570 [marine sediment metagenome]|uniref:HTH marR-type domain-containing protein n=1 Tax=marine sediment metagenome TaxID=412755 RepID=A0A0F9JKN0_9ZZZZ